MQNISIRTTYHGPTDTRGAVVIAKVVVTDDNGSKVRHQRTVPYDHAHSGVNMHAVVATVLATTLGWTGDLACREVRGGTHYEFKGWCVAVHGLTVTPDGVFGPTEVVPKRPPAVFFTNHGGRA